MKKYIIIFSIILLLAVLLYAQPGPISPFIIRFLDLIDAPTTFTGQATKYVRVNAGETALEFAAVAGGGDLLSDGSVPLTANWDAGNFTITAKGFQADTADASDPTITLKTTNTANQIDLTLDEDKGDDWLRICGQTALKDTIVAIDAIDGENAYLRLYSGNIFSYIRQTDGDNLEIGHITNDHDIIWTLYDGGAPKTLTWDGDVDRLKHSHGLFHFDDDNITTTGTIEGGTLTEGGTGVYNTTESDAAYQPLEATLTDIADGTINENLINTANPWADNEIADAHSHAADAIDAITEVAAALKSGADTTFITGTAAANGQLSMFNADGDLVDASVTAAALAAIDTEAELEALLELQDLQGAVTSGQIPDLFIKLGGDVATAGNYDFGGADFELPQASPGVPDADGEVEVDFTDGTVVLQHGSAHAELAASTDVVVAKLIRSWGGTIFEPDGVNDVITVKAINSIEFPHGVVITAIYLGVSENSNYTLTVQNFDDFDTINAANPTIDAVAYVADATGEIIDSTPTYATIAAGQIIMISIPATDVDWIHFEIYYYEPTA